MDNPVKTPEIELSISVIEKELCELEENAKGLEARLDPVLISQTPVQTMTTTATSVYAGEYKIAEPVKAPHSLYYNRLENIRTKITGLGILLTNIKQRLEV